MEFTTRFELQSQATRLFESASYADPSTRTGLSPSLAVSSMTLELISRLMTASLDYNSACWQISVELFPLHSPLLRESLLVSFPPLSYMLKFSGSSYFTSALFGYTDWKQIQQGSSRAQLKRKLSSRYDDQRIDPARGRNYLHHCDEKQPTGLSVLEETGA